MRYMIVFTVLAAFITAGCENRSYVRFEDSIRTTTYTMYRKEIHQAGNSMNYYFAGDNRENFKPTICGPYYGPMVWYLSYCKIDNGDLFTFVTYGTESADITEYDVWTIKNPEVILNSSPYKKYYLEGSGEAICNKYKWDSKNKKLELIHKDIKKAKISFAFSNDRPIEFLPIGVLEPVAQILNYPLTIDNKGVK